LTGVPGMGLSTPTRYRLRVTRGPSEGLVMETTSPQLSIGSGPGNDLVLNDLQISRRHLVVEWYEGGYWIRYAGTMQGVVIGDRGLHSLMLRDQAELMLGDTTLHFELLG